MNLLSCAMHPRGIMPLNDRQREILLAALRSYYDTSVHYRDISIHEGLHPMMKMFNQRLADISQLLYLIGDHNDVLVN